MADEQGAGAKRAPRAEAGTEGRVAPHEALVITGPEFRHELGWGKDRFYAAAKSGRFAHLVSLNASSPGRIRYVRAKVEAWISER
jgi:predicted DNA-binding transcriptional regulator AlpA